MTLPRRPSCSPTATSNRSGRKPASRHGSTGSRPTPSSPTRASARRKLLGDADAEVADDDERDSRTPARRSAITPGGEPAPGHGTRAGGAIGGERAAIVQCYHNNLSHEEAAYVLDCPVGTVKTHLLRGKVQLKRAACARGDEVQATMSERIDAADHGATTGLNGACRGRPRPSRRYLADDGFTARVAARCRADALPTWRKPACARHAAPDALRSPATVAMSRPGDARSAGSLALLGRQRIRWALPIRGRAIALAVATSRRSEAPAGALVLQREVDLDFADVFLAFPLELP